MRHRFSLALTTLLILATSCGPGGNNVPKDTPAEVQLTVSELEHFDDVARAGDIGKVGEVTGMVISSKRAASNERKFGSHFIYIYTEKGPEDKFQPRISCYTWGNPGLKPGNKVRLKGNIGRGAAFGYSLLNCHVERR
jgi:hypothetical protein